MRIDQPVLRTSLSFSMRSKDKSNAPLVVVFDDDASVREALFDLVLSARYQPVTFASPRELLAADGVLDRPGCLILYVRMPGASGLDFQQRLVQDGIAKPIVFLTARGDVSMTVQAMKAGAIDFLTNPVRDQALLDAVFTCICRRRRAAAGIGYCLGECRALQAYCRRCHHEKQRALSVSEEVAEVKNICTGERQVEDGDPPANTIGNRGIGQGAQRGLVHKNIRPAQILAKCTDGRTQLTRRGTRAPARGDSGRTRPERSADHQSRLGTDADHQRAAADPRSRIGVATAHRRVRPFGTFFGAVSDDLQWIGAATLDSREDLLS